MRVTGGHRWGGQGRPGELTRVTEHPRQVTASAKAQGWEVLVCLRSGKPASQGEALSYRLEEVGQTGLHPAGL